jgi:hypothetical protein
MKNKDPKFPEGFNLKKSKKAPSINRLPPLSKEAMHKAT